MRLGRYVNTHGITFTMRYFTCANDPASEHFRWIVEVRQEDWGVFPTTAYLEKKYSQSHVTAVHTLETELLPALCKFLDDVETADDFIGVRIEPKTTKGLSFIHP